jgi:CubicO group peptidase (beta-lactamase class C family)
MPSPEQKNRQRQRSAPPPVAAALLACFTLALAHSSAQNGNGKLASVLQPFVDDQTIAGAVVLVGNPEENLDVEAVGWMDIAAKKPMRTDSLFWIASQSKPLTCTALMILADEGKVNIDDPVEKYLPEFKAMMVATEKDAEHVLLTKPKQPMLVRQLMSHISGLSTSRGIDGLPNDVLPLKYAVIASTMSPLEAEPGTNYRYSNPGMNTVGRLVEVASGLPYEKFMEERIFKPLGMKDTTFWPTAEQLTRLAKSYRPTKDKTGLEEAALPLTPPFDDHSKRYPFPAGGLFSTAEDLSHFYRMIANDGVYEGHRILSREALAQMTTDHTGDLKKAYGFGFVTDGHTVTHGGAYHTQSAVDRNRQLITVFLVQAAEWNARGAAVQPAFNKAARDEFAANKPPVASAPAATPAQP